MTTIHERNKEPRRSEYLTLTVHFSGFSGDVCELVSAWRQLIVDRVDLSRLEFYVDGGEDISAFGSLADIVHAKLVSDAKLVTSWVFDSTEKHDKRDYASVFEYCGSSTDAGYLQIACRIESLVLPAAETSISEVCIPLITQIANKVEATTGLVDISDCWDSGFGRAYAGSTKAFIPFQRQLARYLWEKDKASGAAQGVFWGTVLGPLQLSRLGGRETFLSEYSRAALSYPGERSIARNLDYGGALVLLTGSVDQFLIPFHSLPPLAFRRAEWLHRRLAAARLLPGYTGDLAKIG